MAYTYLIGWSNLNIWYYGVRFAKNCKPEDLWKTYFTSSKRVKNFRINNGEPNIIEIRKTFNNSHQARLWETAVIKRLNLVNKTNWLNMTDNTHKFYHEGPRGKFTEEHREKLSKAKIGRILSQEHKLKLITSRIGRKNSEKQKTALLNSRLDSKHSEETKLKMSIIRKNNINLSKLSSNAGIISAEKRKQTDYNKTVHSNTMKLWWEKRKEKLRQGGIV